MIEEKPNDKVVRLVRVYLRDNESERAKFEQEPEEPRPQDCCGQSCRPCVFDIHADDVVRWAKDCAREIAYGDESLLEHVFGDSGKIKHSPNSSEELFTKEKFTPMRLAAIEKMTRTTNLYRFETTDKDAAKALNLPLGSHLRVRYATFFR